MRPYDETGFNPFDPIQDTESCIFVGSLQVGIGGFNPFDPIQDTESVFSGEGRRAQEWFQPIRSDTGY